MDEKLPGLREESSEPQPANWDALLETAVESGTIIDTGLSIVLTDEHSLSKRSSVFFGHLGPNAQDYTLVEIDATAFKNGGVLMIDVWVGESEVSGSFDLFAGDAKELVPDNALASAKDIPTNQREVIKYPFNQGQVFTLGAIGNASEKGKINGFLAKISVAPTSAKNDEN